MAHDRCNCYFSFWAIFCPFTPLTAKNIKIKKKNDTNAWSKKRNMIQGFKNTGCEVECNQRII